MGATEMDMTLLWDAMGTNVQNPGGGGVCSSFWPKQSAALRPLHWRVSFLECFSFSYNCPVTWFMSFVKCHHPLLTTPSKGTLAPAPVGSVPYPALYWFPSCIICYLTTHYNVFFMPIPHTDQKLNENGDYCTFSLLLCSLRLECAQKMAAIQ